ncbi:MAG: hypothetical protein V3T23_07505 [Nitrososphaerales archaeon]
MVDLDNEFDREVWHELCKARGCMEKAMVRATQLGHPNLADNIDKATAPILRLQGDCHIISKQQ